VAASIDVYERRRPNGEFWYGVKVNGRDLEAEWADPDAARGRGERYARELRGRGGTKMETTTPDEPDQTLPEPDEDPDKDKPDKDTPPGHDPEGPGESENAPGHTKPEPKDDEDAE
jgi:hypothetical protein